MKNIMIAKEAIKAEVILLESKLSECRNVLYSLNNISLGEETGIILSIGENVMERKVDERYKDYPFSKRLVEKLEYLDNIYPRAWRLKTRLEQMVQIEGEDYRIKIKRFFSQNLKILINQGVYVGAKYNNNNKTQFYCRPEWLSEDKLSIKDEFAPLQESLVDIPKNKRGNEFIVWVTQKNND